MLPLYVVTPRDRQIALLYHKDASTFFAFQRYSLLYLGPSSPKAGISAEPKGIMRVRSHPLHRRGSWASQITPKLQRQIVGFVSVCLRPWQWNLHLWCTVCVLNRKHVEKTIKIDVAITTTTITIIPHTSDMLSGACSFAWIKHRDKHLASPARTASLSKAPLTPGATATAATSAAGWGECPPPAGTLSKPSAS